MRTIVDLPKNFIDALSEICETEKISRAEAVRRAVESYISLQKASKCNAEKAFGLWKGKIMDSLDYEDRIRSEWDNEHL